MTTRAARLQSIRDFVVAKVREHPSDIGLILADEFTMSRQASNKHLRRLTNEGLFFTRGNTRAKEYRLAMLASNHVDLEVTPELAEHEVWMDHIFPSLGEISRNVEDICQFGFTEMLNNVVDHSDSPSVRIGINRTAADILLVVADTGVGIFRKVQEEYGYHDARDALLQLSKGKLTTAKEAHSGQGFSLPPGCLTRFMRCQALYSLAA